MNHHYVKVIGCLIISFSGYILSFSQTNGPEFLQGFYNLNGLYTQEESKLIPANNLNTLDETDLDTTLTGRITTVHGNEGINKVIVSLYRNGSILQTDTTGSDGRYLFNIVLTGEETIIVPEKNDKHRNGVSTLDLLGIQKHLLGKEVFTAADQYIAADANNSVNVSAIDLIEIRKLILGTYSEFPSNKSWRFVVKQDTLKPWNNNQDISFTDSLPPNSDFYGIKIGDINNSVDPGLAQLHSRESLAPMNLLADPQSYKVDDIIKVPIRISSDQALTGFQFTLAANGMEIIGLLPGAISIGDDDYALFNDQMTVSWFDEDNVALSAGDVLFTIQLRAHEAGDLSNSLSINSSITEAELYVDGEQTFVPELRMDSPDSRGELAILSCSPNPWKDETRVSFYLPQSDQVTYTLTHVNGKRIKSFSENVSAGYQSLILKSSDFAARGMIFLEIRAGKCVAVKKMIVLE
ncbi:MAG: hypothetical protein IPL92_14495 [Saprospiraceae bacterium]|nr:hypothetical protein [Candidatus Opimibacter iunctus]